jgi:isoleucyl-tRNA synthetase
LFSILLLFFNITKINKKHFEGYGVDALRFWIASTSYSSDISISPSYIEDAANHIRKLRNTARFILGNLNDFDQGF